MAIGRLAIRRAVIKQLRIEELDVGRLRVRELEVESGASPADGLRRAAARAAGLKARHIRNEVEALQGPRI